MSTIETVQAVAEPPKPLMQKINWVRAAPWLYTIALFAVWELVVLALQMPATILPAPSRIFEAVVQYWSPIWKNSLQTLYTTTLGFAIAVVAGLGIGLFIGWSKTIYAGLYPLMIGFNAVPKVALVPILVIWFGIGTVPADRPCHHRAGNRRRSACAGCQEAGYHAQSRHSALHALLFRFAENCDHTGLRWLCGVRDSGFQLWPWQYDELGAKPVQCASGLCWSLDARG
jgi:hypothetical protein